MNGIRPAAQKNQDFLFLPLPLLPVFLAHGHLTFSFFFFALQALSKNFDPDSIVSVELEHLGLISINDPSQFTIRVTGGDDAELAVSVQGKLYFNFCRAVGIGGAGGGKGSNCLPPPTSLIFWQVCYCQNKI